MHWQLEAHCGEGSGAPVQPSQKVKTRSWEKEGVLLHRVAIPRPRATWRRSATRQQRGQNRSSAIQTCNRTSQGRAISRSFAAY